MELTCPSCGSPNVATGSNCWNCQAGLSPILARGPDDLAFPPDSPAENVCPDPSCGELNGPNARNCDYCGTELDGAEMTSTAVGRSPAAELWFADGTVITLLDGHAVVLGREAPDGRIADALTRASGVSRQHASVQLVAGALVVVDHQSMNGTYVDDVRVKPALTVPLRNVSLRLGQNYQIRVTAAGRNGND